MPGRVRGRHPAHGHVAHPCPLGEGCALRRPLPRGHEEPGAGCPRAGPGLHAAFMAGEFVVATSPVPFTAIDSDQALGHAHGAAKGTGGVAGKHVDSQNALRRHALTLHKRMQLNLDW